MEALQKLLEKAQADNPEDAEKFADLLRSSTAFNYQPLVLPYLEIKSLS